MPSELQGQPTVPTVQVVVVVTAVLPPVDELAAELPPVELVAVLDEPPVDLTVGLSPPVIMGIVVGLSPPVPIGSAVLLENSPPPQAIVPQTCRACQPPRSVLPPLDNPQVSSAKCQVSNKNAEC